MDDQQADLFGATPKALPKPRPARQRAAPALVAAPAAPAVEARSAPAGPPEQTPDPVATAAQFSPAELDALVAALPDDALARLLLASVRQLRRRLSRAAGRPAPALDRAARQIAAEFTSGDDDP